MTREAEKSDARLQGLSEQLDGWLRERNAEGWCAQELVGALALLLGDLLGMAASAGFEYTADALQMMLVQREGTVKRMADEDEDFDLEDEDDLDESDKIEGEEDEADGEEGFPG